MAETTLTRRSFVKASALVGATAAFGASMAGCMQEAPQEQAPSGGGADEGLVRMKTSCHGCIQMCPAIAYLKGGVVVKLEGDPDAPVSRGSLCIKGLNQLHTMYSPRRVLHPLRRAGERGEDKWEEIPYEQAMDEIADKLQALIDKYGPETLVSSAGTYRSDHLWARTRFFNHLGHPGNVIDPGTICWCWNYTLNMAMVGWPIADLSPVGIEICCIPSFADIVIDGEYRTAIRFAVEPRGAAAIAPIVDAAAVH